MEGVLHHESTGERKVSASHLGVWYTTRNAFLHKGNIMQKTPSSSWKHHWTCQFQVKAAGLLIPVSMMSPGAAEVQLPKVRGTCSSRETFTPLVLPITKPEMPVLLGHQYWISVPNETCQKHQSCSAFTQIKLLKEITENGPPHTWVHINLIHRNPLKIKNLTWQY